MFSLRNRSTRLSGLFPYDHRRSRIADDRKESCFQIIADDRKRSQSRLLHTFRTAEVSKLHARCASEKIAANNMAYVEGEILLQANLFFLQSTDFEIVLAHLAPRQKVAFSVDDVYAVLMLRNLTYASVANLFVFVFQIFIVMVVKALIARSFLYKFLVIKVILLNASHVYK